MVAPRGNTQISINDFIANCPSQNNVSFKRLQYCNHDGISLRLVKCALSYCSKIQRERINHSRHNDATNHIGKETPYNVNERDCERRNDCRQLCLALILVKAYVTRACELYVLRGIISKRFSHRGSLNSTVNANSPFCKLFLCRGNGFTEV